MMNSTQVLLPHAVRTPTPGESSDDGVYDLAASSAVVLGRIVPPFAAFLMKVVVLGLRRGAVSLPWCFLSTRGVSSGVTALHKAAQVPCLNQLLYFVFQSLTLFSQMTGVLMILILLAAIDVVETKGPSGWRDQLRAKGFLQYFPSIGVEGCVSWEPRPTIISLGITPSRPSLAFLLILLLAARLCPSLVPKLAKLFQLHKLGGSTPKFV